MSTGAKETKPKCELCKKALALKLPRRHPHHKEGPLQAWSVRYNRFINVCSKCSHYLDPNPEEGEDSRTYRETNDHQPPRKHPQPDPDEEDMEPPDEDTGSTESEYTD